MRRAALCLVCLAITLGACGTQHANTAAGSRTKALTELAYATGQAELRCKPAQVAVVNRQGEKTCRKMTTAELFAAVRRAFPRCPTHVLEGRPGGGLSCAPSKK